MYLSVTIGVKEYPFKFVEGFFESSYTKQKLKLDNSYNLTTEGRDVVKAMNII